MDEDGDGKISIAEAKKYGITVTLFQKLDTDNSGFLTQRDLRLSKNVVCNLERHFVKPPPGGFSLDVLLGSLAPTQPSFKGTLENVGSTDPASANAKQYPMNPTPNHRPRCVLNT
jgi:hypothetical protein